MLLFKLLLLFVQDQEHVNLVWSVEEVNESHLPVLVVRLFLSISHFAEFAPELVYLLDHVINRRVNSHCNIKRLVCISWFIRQTSLLYPIGRKRQTVHYFSKPIFFDSLFLNS